MNAVATRSLRLSCRFHPRPMWWLRALVIAIVAFISENVANAQDLLVVRSSLPDSIRRELARDENFYVPAYNPSTRLRVPASGPAIQVLEVRNPGPVFGVQRPRHALAFRNDALTSALQNAGISASDCYAPIVRSHSRLKQSSGLSIQISVTLSVRCAF
ncbi:MAG TPA: hypothetical protein VFS42_08080 [Burkholderiaceae bacterium]|nr:hypothetical protein [Burkholderiaceae bacterium]